MADERNRNPYFNQDVVFRPTSENEQQSRDARKYIAERRQKAEGAETARYLASITDESGLMRPDPKKFQEYRSRMSSIGSVYGDRMRHTEDVVGNIPQGFGLQQPSGGTANAAENPAAPATKPAPAGPQPATTDQQGATGPGLMNLVRETPGGDGRPAIGVYQGQHGTVYQMGQPGQENYGWAQVHGKPQQQTGAAGNRQAAQPGLGLRDLGNGQVAVGQVGGFQNPGYGFVGSREDAARFFQPVPHGGGYNPYKQQFRTLFDEQMDARRAAKAAPRQEEQPGMMGWQRLRDKMNNESRERIAEMTGGFGLEQAGMADARARAQMNQQYGFNMANLANSNAQTQAALGLNFLQQQGQQLQNAQSREQMAAYQRWRNAPPGSPQQAQAALEMQMLGGGGVRGRDGDKMNDVVTLNDPVNGSFQVQNVRDADGNVFQRRVTEQAGQGDFGALYADEKAWLEQSQIESLNKLPKEKREKAKEAAFLQFLKSRQ